MAAAIHPIEAPGKQICPAAVAQQARMDDNFEANLRSCHSPEAIQLDQQQQQQQHRDRLCAEQTQGSLTFTAPIDTRRAPIRALSPRLARFNGRPLLSDCVTSSATASPVADNSQRQQQQQQPSQLQQPHSTVNQIQKLHRQQPQTWPTSLISSLVSSRTKLNSSKAVPITRNGVHQSIRLHRNTLLAEQRLANTAEVQQVNNNCCSTAAAALSTIKHTAAIRLNHETQIRSPEPSRLNYRTGSPSSTTTNKLPNQVRRGSEQRSFASPTAKSSASSTASRPSASSATTNSRVRQAALYARRQYHITPKPATSLVAANLAHTRASSQASHASSSSASSPLQLRLSASLAAAAQSSRLSAAGGSTTGRSPLSSSCSSPLANALVHSPSKSSLALNLIHRSSNSSSTTRRERFNIKPLKSSSKFSLTSSTSSLTLTAVKRVKPSEPQHQQVNTNKENSCERKAKSGHLGGSLLLSSSINRESHSRHFLSARRGLSGCGSSTLAATNRKPTTRANRNAASNGSAKVNISSASKIIAKNTTQTNNFAGLENGLLPTTTTTTTTTTTLPPPTSENNCRPSTLDGDRLLSVQGAKSIVGTPSYLVNNKSLLKQKATTTKQLPDILLKKQTGTTSIDGGGRCGSETTNESGFCFNSRGSYVQPNNRQLLDEIHPISADNDTNHPVDYKLNLINDNTMVDSQQDKHSALNASDLVNKSNSKGTINNSVLLVKGPLSLHLSSNISKTHKRVSESAPTTNKSLGDENEFETAISSNHNQVENLPPKTDTTRSCQRNIFLQKQEDGYSDDQAKGCGSNDDAIESIVALVSGGQNNCCDSRSEAESTDSRKAMDCQEEENEETDQDGKQEVRSDEELLSSSVSMQRTNSLDSNLEVVDEHMVLGSPLVTPPPSELDVDESQNSQDNNNLAISDSEIHEIGTTNSDQPLKANLRPSIVPVAELSIPIRTEPISDYYDLELRPFARGKFAQVKRCIHKSSQKCFAAKCIKKRRRLIDIRQEILLEIEALKLSFYTNHIVKLYEVYETSTEMILVLEMANGGELQRVLDDEEAIEETQVKRMVKQILEGLTYLHDNDIAHLDIKPQNLLLTESFPNGEVKLCDFGISRRITKDCEIREICGTPDYVAPEILRYDPISLATDIWSLGVLTYVLLSGYSPFGSENKQQTFCNITQAALDFPSEIFDKISKEAIDFMQKLIVREPSKRLTSRQARKHSWLNQ